MVCSAQSKASGNHVQIVEGREIQRSNRRGKRKVDLELIEEYLKEKNKNKKVGVSGAIQ